MQWLTPLTGLYAAAVTVPILLLMYFLKLKRQERIISSTLLWKRAIQDLQVNAPFQKMRRNILLLLQILILAALLLSLAGPIASMTGGPGKRHVLLIDRSASMNATDVDDSRLAQAKEQATLYVESLRDKNAFSLQDNSDQAMIITFDDHSKVLCNFTSDKRQLIEAIKQITPGEGKSTLSEAVMVARAFAQSPGEETNSRSAQSAAQLVLFSDGRIDDIGKLESGSEDLLFQKIGQSGENIAITAMQARRSYENPEEVTLFATLANYGDTDQKCQLQLSINNNVYAVKPVTIPARLMTDNPTDTPDDNAKTIEKPGELAVNYDLTHNEGGVLEMRLLSDDLLACDNAAWAVLAPPKRLSVLLVTEGNVVLKTVLQACPIAKLAECTPDEFENAEHSEGAVFYNQHPYDIIILDDCVPVKPSSKLPRCRYLVFGRPPDGIDITVKEDLESQVIIDWRTRHAIMKHVNLNNIFAAKSYQLELPRDAEVLAEFSDTPAITLLRRQGSIFLIAGFNILESNWPFEPGFVMFCYNAIDFLGMQSGDGQMVGSDLAVGEPIIIEGLAPETPATLTGPDIPALKIKASAAGTIRFSQTQKAGIYNIVTPQQDSQQDHFFAVNILNRLESDIKPLDEIEFGHETIAARTGPVSRTNLPLWPYLIAFAIFVTLTEWIVYIYKVNL